MAHYALLRIKHVPGNPRTPDEIARELLRAQENVSWGRDAKVVPVASNERLYDQALRLLDDNCKAAKRRWELVDPARMLVRVTDARKYRKRKPKSWESFLRVVDVKISSLEIGHQALALTPLVIPGR